MDNFSTRSPKDYYYNNQRNWELSDLENTDSGSGSESESDNLVDFKLRKKQNFIILSSLDRNWTDLSNKETPFNFSIQINNTNNFNTLKLNNRLKNIISIAVPKMILNNKHFNIDYKITDKKIKFTDINYLVVDINGFNNINTGTNDILSSATAIMISITPIPTALNMRTIEFKNINTAYKSYPINPIFSLNRFNVSIKNNLGFSPNPNSRDVLKVNQIGFTNTANVNKITDFITLTTREYFNDEKSTGDIIIIKNYKCLNTNGASTDNVVAFENFINRDQGHKIIETLDPPAGDVIFKNKINIARPYELNNPEDGMIKTKDFLNQIAPNGTPLDDDVSELNCVLINVSLQTTVFINIDTLEKENTISGQLI